MFTECYLTFVLIFLNSSEHPKIIQKSSLSLWGLFSEFSKIKKEAILFKQIKYVHYTFFNPIFYE